MDPADFVELSSTPESSFYLANAGGIFYEDDSEGAGISRSRELPGSLDISSSGAPDASVSLADLSPSNGADDGPADQASPGIAAGSGIPAGAGDGVPLDAGGSSSLNVEEVKSNASPDTVASPSPDTSINSGRFTTQPAGGANTTPAEPSGVISIGSASGTQSTDRSSLSSGFTGLSGEGDAAAFPPSGVSMLAATGTTLGEAREFFLSPFSSIHLNGWGLSELPGEVTRFSLNRTGGRTCR